MAPKRHSRTGLAGTITINASAETDQSGWRRAAEKLLKSHFTVREILRGKYGK
jgi:hypothetical protein